MTEALPPVEDAPVVIRRIEHGRPADREFVLSLLREYLASLPAGGDAEARYRWLYLNNPHGGAVTYLAWDRETGEAAGLTSLFPRHVLCGDRQRRGAIGGDGYVRPAFRRRGIARELHRVALAGMAAAGLDFMYGPPEPHNLRALLGAGSVVVGRAQRFVRPLSPRGLLPWLHPGGVPVRALGRLFCPPRSPLRLLPLGDQPDRRVDQVFAAVLSARASDEAVLPVRDAAFCSWRFGRCPSGRQRSGLLLDGDLPVALVALEISAGRRRVALIEVLCPAPRRKDVLGGLLAACPGQDSAEIQVHTPSALQRTLLRLGFLPRKGKPFQVQAPQDHPERPLLLRPAGWSYLWGDGDVDQVL